MKHQNSMKLKAISKAKCKSKSEGLLAKPCVGDGKNSLNMDVFSNTLSVDSNPYLALSFISDELEDLFKSCFPLEEKINSQPLSFMVKINF